MKLTLPVEPNAAQVCSTGKVNFIEGYPATINHKREAELSAEVGRGVFGPENVITEIFPNTGGEDFAFFLQAVPGAYIWVGQGREGGFPIHHTCYDFDDRIIPNGAGLLAAIAEKELE